MPSAHENDEILNLTDMGQGFFSLYKGITYFKCYSSSCLNAKVSQSKYN